MLVAQNPKVLLGDLAALDTDCACPLPPQFAPRAPADPATPFLRVAALHQEALTEEWGLHCNPLAGGAPAVLNTPAELRLAAFAKPRLLVDDIDQQLHLANLIAPIGTQYSAPTNAPDRLTAWLHITNACNLECPYCYVRKSGERMTLETGQRAVDALITSARRHGFRVIKLKYAGGEAALHYRMVQQLHAYALERCARAGITLQAVVLSNGTVMPEPFADWLAASGVRLMLSVDGVGAAHDDQRPFKVQGPGAFAALERNLTQRLLPRGILPDICITITGRNALAAHTAVEWAMNHDLPFSLNFYREHDQSARYAELRYEEQQIIQGMLAAYAAIERTLPRRPFLDGLLDRVQAQSHGHTCGVGSNYVVITHTGQAAQCQMELAQSQPFEPDTDLIPLIAEGALQNVRVDDKEGCRDCQWRYRCTGGCPLVTLRATGRTDIKSPNCAIYQTLMPAALRLEGLRILKYHLQISQS